MSPDPDRVDIMMPVEKQMKYYFISKLSKRGDPKHFCGRVPWLYQYWPCGFMLFVVLCPGTPEGSTSSDSGFKASQKTGQRLKVSSDRLGEAGNRTCDPGLQDIGLSASQVIQNMGTAG